MLALHVLLTIGCEVPDPPPTPVVDEAQSVPLDGAALFRRQSLDLRGTFPTLDELDRAAAGEGEALLDALLVDPRTEERLVDLFAERWLTRVDRFPLEGQLFGYSGADDVAFRRAVGEEPIRLIARVVADDRPWEEVVTGDTTLAEETLAGAWPVAYPEGATGWQEVTWTDARPAMGVLATNGLWWRYGTSQGNLNRHRAAAITSLLLCEDYLARPVAVTSLDPAAGSSVEELVRSNPSCLSCHSSLDPLSATLFGFWWFDGTSPEELTMYHRERAALGSYFLELEPAWFGRPVTADTLGATIAADPRLGRCAVQSVAELLWRRPVDLDDFDTLVDVEADLRTSGFHGHDLLRAIVATDAYRVGALASDAPEAAAARERTRRLMTDTQFARAVADLTGFTWSEDGVRLLSDDEVGYRVLAGGVDGVTVTRPLFEPGVTRAVTFQRLAEAAASYTVARGYAGESAVFDATTLASRPGDDTFREALADVRRRLAGVAPSDEVLEGDAALWSAVAELEGEQAAWAAVLAVILRDPATQVY